MPRGGIVLHYADIGDTECRRRNHGACRNYPSATEPVRGLRITLRSQPVAFVQDRRLRADKI